MDNDAIQVLTQIIEKGGTISWRGKYFLDFIDKWNINPDKEWSGYEICKLNKFNSYQSIYKSMNLENILYYFNDIIDDETRNDFINHYER
jgi:hypothetical protein